MLVVRSTQWGDPSTQPTLGGKGTKLRLLEVTDLAKYFPLHGGVLGRRVGWLKAVDGVTFNIEEGETLGLVGESGSGKSTLGRTLMRLLEPTRGQIKFDGEMISDLKGLALKQLRKSIQLIFQDPYAALDPRMKVEDIVAEGLNIHKLGTPAERAQRVVQMLEKVGLEAGMLGRRPGEFSAGQRQRISLARALVLEPRFIIADEPVSALDVSVQARVLNLMEELQEELGLTTLFIAHNLRVVEHFCDRVAVCIRGKLSNWRPP